MTQCNEPSALHDAVAWITREIVGNEMRAVLPVSLRPLIAARMVKDEFMGWPDLEAADQTLDGWTWSEG